MTNEFVGAVQAIIVAVFGVLQAFNVYSLTDTQNGTILALYGAVAAFVLLVNSRLGKPAAIRRAAASQGVNVAPLGK